MKRITAIVLALGAITLFSFPVYANSTGNQGQPNQSCQSFFGDAGPFTPSGFNTVGFNHAETVYAGAPTELEQSRGGVPVRRSLLSGSLALERQRGRAEPPPTPPTINPVAY